MNQYSIMNQLFPRRMDLYVLVFGGYSIVFNLVKHGHHQYGGFLRTDGGNVRWFQVVLGIVALLSALRSLLLRSSSHSAADEYADSLEAQKEKARRQHRKLSIADSRFRRKHDQIDDGGASAALDFPLIQRIPYAHGGFFGAAPFLLSDPKWTTILRTLMPQVYVDISRKAAQAASPHELILWAENNPVCAAYGVISELRKTGSLPNIEWDVFLDPVLVDRLEIFLDERTAYREHLGLSVSTGEDASLSFDERTTLASYDAQVAAQTTELVNNMMIAHGSLLQLFLEQTGFAKSFNFASIKKTSPTLGGGFTARTWIQCFAEALLMGMDDDQDKDSSSTDSESTSSTISSSTSSTEKIVANNKNERKILRPTYWAELLARATSTKTTSRPTVDGDTQPAGASTETIATSDTPSESPPHRFTTAPTSMAKSLSIIRQVTGCSSPLGIVFDLKSRHVSQRVWARVIDTMRQAGLRVEGIGSFDVLEISDLSRFTLEPVRDVVFFHSAGDLQKACDAGLIREGASVFFNAGSLIWEPQGIRQALWSGCRSTAYRDDYKLLPFVVSDDDGDILAETKAARSGSTLQDYKERYQLSIGLYCQEFAIDHGALNVIVDYVNQHQHIIDLGLSWGGFNGTTTRGIKPTWWEPSDGMWKQRYAGTSWDTTRFPIAPQ